MIRLRSPLLFIILVGAGLRLLAIPPGLGDLDAANFAAALDTFDPTHQAPHWPGYPVYIAAARFFHALGFDAHVALALPGVAGFLIAAPLFFDGVRRVADERVAYAVTFGAALLPGALVVGGWPGSDGLGLAVLLAAIGLALRSRAEPRAAIAVGVLIGLGLGVRLSWWPLLFGVFGLAAAHHRWRIAAAAVVTTAAWGLVLFAIVGTPMLEQVLGFGVGHFTRFGGAITESASIADRFTAYVGLFERGALGGVVLSIMIGAAVRWFDRPKWILVAALPVLFGAPPLAVVVGGLIGYGAAPYASRGHLWVGLSIALYAVWAFVAQNAERPRHLVPLAMVVGLVGIAGLMRSRLAPAAYVVPVLWLVIAAPLIDAQRTASPHAEIAGAIAAHTDGPTQVFSGPEGRLLERLVPGVRVWRPADSTVLAREAARAAERGATVFITSHAEGVETLPGLVVVGTYEQPRALRGPDHRSTLYRYQPEVSRVASR